MAGTIWSMVPVVTAMALVALGATGATTDRLRNAPASCLVAAVHLVVYLNLYFLIVGAVCHAAIQGPLHGIALLTAADLGISVGPMALAVRQSLVAMAGGGDIPAR